MRTEKYTKYEEKKNLNLYYYNFRYFFVKSCSTMQKSNFKKEVESS